MTKLIVKHGDFSKSDLTREEFNKTQLIVLNGEILKDRLGLIKKDITMDILSKYDSVIVTDNMIDIIGK